MLNCRVITHYSRLYELHEQKLPCSCRYDIMNEFKSGNMIFQLLIESNIEKDVQLK